MWKNKSLIDAISSLSVASVANLESTKVSGEFNKIGHDWSATIKPIGALEISYHNCKKNAADELSPKPLEPGQKESSCVDKPGWYDRDGPTWNCARYATNNYCAWYGNGYRNDLVANEACCVCGGGTQSVGDGIGGCLPNDQCSRCESDCDENADCKGALECRQSDESFPTNTNIGGCFSTNPTNTYKHDFCVAAANYRRVSCATAGQIKGDSSDFTIDPWLRSNIADENVGDPTNLIVSSQGKIFVAYGNYERAIPTEQPSSAPSSLLSQNPSLNLSSNPSLNPSSNPSLNPSSIPSQPKSGTLTVSSPVAIESENLAVARTSTYHGTLIIYNMTEVLDTSTYDPFKEGALEKLTSISWGNPIDFDDIEGEFLGGDFGGDYGYGTSLSVSGDGNTVAIGSPDYDGEDFKGRVKVLTIRDGVWKPTSDLDKDGYINSGENVLGFGRRMILSHDGKIIVVAANGRYFYAFQTNEDTYLWEKMGDNSNIQVQEGVIETLAISYLGDDNEEVAIDVGAVLEDGSTVVSQFRVSMLEYLSKFASINFFSYKVCYFS